MVLFPIIEIFSTMCVNANLSITPGAIYKLMILVYVTIYILFVNKVQRNYTNIFIALLGITSIISCIVTLNSFTIKEIAYKLLEISKFVAFPLYTIFFISYNKTEKVKLPIKTIATTASIYALVIFIAYITNTSMPTYIDTNKNITYGIRGWYNSANELGAIFAIGYPIMWLYIIKKPSISKYIALSITTFAMLNIATKSATLSVLGTLICILVFGIILKIKGNIAKDSKTCKLAKNALTISLITLTVTCIFFTKTPAYEYNIRRYLINNNTGDELIEDMVLNGRQYKMEELKKRYSESSLINKLFGINNKNKMYSATNNEYMIVERDFHDILFNYGAIGLAIYISFIGIVIVKILVNIFKSFKDKNKTNKIRLKTLILGMASMLGFGAAFIAGHTISSTTVALFLALAFGTLYCIMYDNKEKTE